MGLGASKQKGASLTAADVAWATKSWIQVAPKPAVKDEAQAAEAQARKEAEALRAVMATQQSEHEGAIAALEARLSEVRAAALLGS